MNPAAIEQMLSLAAIGSLASKLLLLAKNEEAIRQLEMGGILDSDKAMDMHETNERSVMLCVDAIVRETLKAGIDLPYGRI